MVNLKLLSRVPACAAILAAAILAQQKYTGPLPPQKDLPYLVHGDNLLATDATVAQSQEKKNDTTYTIPGEAAKAKTPLASPIFVFESAKIEATRLQLFHLDVRNGHREVTFQKRGRGGAQPLKLSVSPVSGSVYRIEAAESLPNGEYALTPDGSNDAFCFTVY